MRPVVELSALLDEPLAIQGVVPSPAGDAVSVNTMPTDDLTRAHESSVHRISVETVTAVEEFLGRESALRRHDQAAGISDECAARRKQRDHSYLGSAKRLHLPPRAGLEAVSPDGSRLLLRFPGRDTRMSTDAELWVGERDALLAAGTQDDARRVLRDVTAGVDQACFMPVWHDLGIDVVHAEGTKCTIRRLDPDGVEPPQRLDTGEVYCHLAFHTTRLGQVGFIGGTATTYPEAWALTDRGPRRLTSLGAQREGWDLGEVRTITWTSEDGTQIEGVLRAPPHFDPSRRYPLAFVVHGGPTWFDMEQLIPTG